MKSVCVILPILLGYVAALSLPSYIKPCKRGPQLNKCAVINGNAAIPLFVKGDPKLKIPSLEPIVVKELSITENSAKSIGLNLTFIDMNIRRMSTAKLDWINIDLNKNKLEWVVDVPLVKIDSKYEVDGKFLVLPIRGKGPCQIDMEKVKFNYTLDFKLQKMKGVEYAIITNSDLKFVTQKLRVKLDNLFDGDKALGDTVNKGLNENWEDLVTRLGPPIAKAIAIALQPIVERVVSQVPFKEIILP